MQCGAYAELAVAPLLKSPKHYSYTFVWNDTFLRRMMVSDSGADRQTLEFAQRVPIRKGVGDSYKPLFATSRFWHGIYPSSKPDAAITMPAIPAARPIAGNILRLAIKNSEERTKLFPVSLPPSRSAKPGLPPASIRVPISPPPA